MSVNESKIFTLIPEKVTRSPIFLLLQLCNSRAHRYSRGPNCRGGGGVIKKGEGG